MRCLPSAQLAHVALPLFGWYLPVPQPRHTGYDCELACHAPPPAKPASQAHADLSFAITPFKHDAAMHGPYWWVATRQSPPPWYPVRHVHADMSLATWPFGQETTVQAGYDCVLACQAP